MRSISVVLVLVAVAIANASITPKPHYDIDKAPELYEQYLKDYNKHYKDEATKNEHYLAFVKALKKINEYNAEPNNTAVFGLNQFTDYTEEEWRKMFPGCKFSIYYYRFGCDV